MSISLEEEPALCSFFVFSAQAPELEAFAPLTPGPNCFLRTLPRVPAATHTKQLGGFWQTELLAC